MQGNDTPKRRRAPRRPPVQRDCAVCGAPFMAWQSAIDQGRARWCSAGCFAAHRRTRLVNPCAQCGAPVETIPSRRKNGKGRFCSKACHDEAQVGDIAERFARLIDRNAPGACWPWVGNISRQTGYGYLTVRNKPTKAHALAWELATGETLPKGAVILHTCDYRRCVRNDDIGIYAIDGIEYPRRGHLVLATNNANMRDMVLKGRSAAGDRHGFRINPDRAARGERVALAKLTEAQVVEIRARYAAGGISQQALADEYGLHQTKISQVIRRVTWKHVP